CRHGGSARRHRRRGHGLARVLHARYEPHLPQRGQPAGAAVSSARHRPELRRLRPAHVDARAAPPGGAAAHARGHVPAPGGRRSAPAPSRRVGVSHHADHLSGHRGAHAALRGGGKLRSLRARRIELRCRRAPHQQFPAHEWRHAHAVARPREPELPARARRRGPVTTPDARLTRDHLEQLFAQMKSRRIVVVGDAMLDIYLAGEAERISPEAPVPVVSVHTRRHALGGAVMADADAILIEDYNKGTLTPAVIERAMTLARKRGIPVVVDPKFKHFFAYRGATLFKPNRRELEQAMGATLDLAHPDALPTSLDKLGVDNLLLTLGAEGMVLVTKDKQIGRIPTMAREVFDVSGAGDT